MKQEKKKNVERIKHSNETVRVFLPFLIWVTCGGVLRDLLKKISQVDERGAVFIGIMLEAIIMASLF